MLRTRKLILIAVIFAVLILPVVNALFATGSPALAPNPIPSACSSNCPAILISGPTLGFAITFSQNNSVTGHFKKISGTTPFNVTLTDLGECNIPAKETPIPINTDGSISPLKSHGYLYCLYYSSLPGAKAYSLEITFKHPGDEPFIQTISWTIP